MIKLITNIPDIKNDIADIIRLFYSFEKIVYDKNELSDMELNHLHAEHDGQWTEKITFVEGVINKDFIYTYSPADIPGELEYKRHLKRSAKIAFYNALKDISGKSLPWGSLTGIRPTQLYRMLDAETGGHAREVLEKGYDVSEEKIGLVENVIKSQKGKYGADCETAVDLYIGIPFCPSRCEYCSFISFDMSRHKAPLDEYKSALIKEINWFNSWKAKYNKKLKSIYVGGGTPTSIPESMLKEILEAVSFEPGTEFTVEAGRPDTINRKMLQMLEGCGVTRISINPQSMNDETLRRMKRPHTSQDIKDAFVMARKFDFIVNMDLILGLEGEGIKELEHTLAEVEKLNVDNLTIHTLAVKRASKLKENMAGYNFTDERTMLKMVDMAHKKAYEMGMHPYYMYRQKYMSGNLENVGFAKEGMDCIYNIDIMEETHNLIALGAGAVSKRMHYDQNRHERFANQKSVLHYISNIDAILLKKDDFFAYN